MDTHTQPEEEGAPRPGGGEANISHFIPSVELKGSLAQKLKTLDTLIVYLERLRRSLAGDMAVGRGGYAGPSRYIKSPSWPWFTGGLFLGALFVVVLLTARGCGQ